MLKKILKKITGYIAYILLFSPAIGLAAANDVDYGNVGAGCPSPSTQLKTIFGCVEKGEGSLAAFVKLAFTWVAGIISSFALMGMIWASYMYITSAGNPDGIAKAKDIIWTSIASVVIVIFSYAFFKLLGVM